MRRKIFFGGLLILLGAARMASAAQQGSSGGDVFAGQDPLSVKGEVMPAASNGQCIPPGNLQWKLLAKIGGTCYYTEPLNPPINGYVTNMDNVGAVEKLGGRCGVDEFDASKAVCQNSGDQFAGAAKSTGLPAGIGPQGGPSGSLPSTGNYRRQIPPPAYDPCHPNYNVSTAAGRAAAQQNAAQDQQVCNDERCKHNPTLPFCGGPTTTVNVPPPGGKDLEFRKPGVPPPEPTVMKIPVGMPNLNVVIDKMNDCLKAKVPYWVPMQIQSDYMDRARQNASRAVRSARPETLKYQTQVFLVETAMGMQAQALHDQKFGAAKPSSPAIQHGTYDPNWTADYSNPAYAPAYVAGWLQRCLATNGMQTDADMRGPYANFLGVGVNDGRIFAFGSGYIYGDVLSPATLLPTTPAQ